MNVFNDIKRGAQTVVDAAEAKPSPSIQRTAQNIRSADYKDIANEGKTVVSAVKDKAGEGFEKAKSAGAKVSKLIGLKDGGGNYRAMGPVSRMRDGGIVQLARGGMVPTPMPSPLADPQQSQGAPAGMPMPSPMGTGQDMPLGSGGKILAGLQAMMQKAPVSSKSKGKGKKKS